MNKQLIKDMLLWGFLFWIIGYILGIMIFSFVPLSIIGWIIMPIGASITIWILLKKINNKSLHHYFILSIAWTLIAVIFDYFFLVKTFKPADGYYKIDVYVYYFLTFALPLIIGWQKNKTHISKS